MQYPVKFATPGVFQLAREGNLDVLKPLLRDFNFQEVEGNGTVLMVAATAGHAHIVKFLIEGGADIDLRDKDGRTALMLAVTNNRQQCVQVLLDHGADPNICSKNGWSSLYIACNKGFTEIATIILYAYDMHKLKGRSVPHLSPLSIDAQNMVGGTALMAACGLGHFGVIQHLLGWQANVNAADMNRFTSLMKAAEKGHTEIVQFLLMHGAGINATNTTGASALHLAAKVGSFDTVKVLLASSYINVNIQDKNSRTALFYAAQNGHSSVVHALWARGANVSIPDRNNHTALTVAKVPEILELLQKPAPPYVAANLFASPVSVPGAPLSNCPVYDNSESSKKSLRSMVALKYSEIPLYLHDSAFFRALNEDEDGENEIVVPGDCFKINDTVANVDDFRLLLRVMMYWGIDKLPFTAIKFCHNHDISMWDYVAEDALAPDQAADTIAGPDSTFLKSLTAVFRAQANKIPLVLAIIDGRMEIIEALIKIETNMATGCEPMTKAAELGRLEAMKLLFEKRFNWDSGTCKQAASGGHLDCLQFAHEQGCQWNADALTAAAANGHILCVKYAMEHSIPCHESATQMAAQNNQFECLVYLLDHGCPASEMVVVEAAKAGFVDCLRHAINHGCPMSPQACTKAAAGGHLNCLNLLQDYNAPWDASAPREAVQHGHFDCLRHLHEHGCPWDKSSPDAAAKVGNVDIMRYLLHNYCPYGDEVLKLAVASGSIDCVEYLIEDRGLYMQDDGSVFGEAFRRADVAMVHFLLELGCPCANYKFKAVKLAKPMGAAFDDNLFMCIRLASEYGWESNPELVEYVTERGLVKCKKYLSSLVR